MKRKFKFQALKRFHDGACKISLLFFNGFNVTVSQIRHRIRERYMVMVCDVIDRNWVGGPKPNGQLTEI